MERRVFVLCTACCFAVVLKAAADEAAIFFSSDFSIINQLFSNCASGRACFERQVFWGGKENGMAEKKENASTQQTSLSKKDEEISRLMEKHPEETMSQVENRYGKGREKNGSDGTQKDAVSNNH